MTLSALKYVKIFVVFLLQTGINQSWSTAYMWHVERPLITDKQTIPMDW